MCAQDPFYITFDVDNGLPSSEVYDIISDSKNSVWISTDRGLVKYDGAIQKVYNSENGLGDNTNFYFNKDKSGRIWMCGYNRKLSYLENDSIFQYKYNKDLNDVVGNEAKRWIKYLDTNYFITFQNYDGVEYFRAQEELLNNKDGAFFEKNASYFAKKDTLVKIYDEFFNYFFYEKTLYTTDWFRVSKAIRNAKNEIVYHNRNTVLKQNLSNQDIEEKVIPFDIEKVYLDGGGNLWVCTREGLVYFEDSNLNAKAKVFFKGLLISCIIEDFQGNYWVGTNDSGVKFVPSFDMSNISVDDNLNVNFLSISIYNDKIAFGTSKSKLVICDKNEDCKVYSVPSQASQASNAQINKIGNWDKNSIILNNGSVFDGENFSIPESPLLDFIIGAFCAKLENDDLIIHTRKESFTVIDQKNKFRITSNKFKNPINNHLYSVAQNAKEDIYLGTAKGLYLVKNYDYSNNKEILDNQSKGLGRISSINIDCHNIAWVSTIGNGTYAVLDDVAYKITDDKNLSNPLINKVIATQDSLLWIATNDGIDVLSYNLEDSLQVKFLRNINQADGLVSTSVNDIEYWDGKIWAATNAGVCNFSPDILNKPVPQIPIVITEFTNQDSLYNIEDELSFERDQNDIFISYSGLSFQQFSEEVEYKYRLVKDKQESEEDWYYTKDRTVRFNDLTHGNYSFEVNAMNKLRVWNDTTAIVRFSIKPRFVETTLFKLLMLFFFALVIYTVVRILNDRNKNRQDRLLELEEAKRKIQEAEISAIRNQMNPHFVYNSLNSIQNLIFKNDSYGANYYLSKFSMLMRQSLQFTSVNFISLRQEFDFLSNYLELEALRFPNKFDYTFILDDSLDAERMRIPSLILQPIVENSIKHGFDNIDYPGVLTIKATTNNNLLEISIKDNGNGVRKAHPKQNKSIEEHKSFGTKMVSNRIELLNKSHFDKQATIKVLQSEVGYQTLFILPIRYD